MKKIVILGCENSHANMFLGFIKNNPLYKDVEVIGVYSEDLEASKKLSEEFLVPETLLILGLGLFAFIFDIV